MSRVGGKRLTTDVETLAAFSRGARNFLNMTQYEFADWIGVARITLVRLELAKPPLSYGVLVAIAKNLREVGITSEAINDILLGVKDNVESIDINIDLRKLKTYKEQHEQSNSTVKDL